MTLRARTLRNAAFASIAMYTEFALGMVTSIIIARHLGPEGFGAYSAVILMVGLGVAMVNSGTASTAIKFVAELRGAGREPEVRGLVTYLRRMQSGFMLAVTLMGAFGLWLAGRHVAPSFHHGWLFLFLVLGIALRAGYMFNIGVAKGLEDFRVNAIVALISAPTNLVLIVLATWFGLGVEWLLVIFLISGLMFYAISSMQVRALLPAGDHRASVASDLLPRVHRQMLYSTLIVSIGFIAASEIEVWFLNAYGDPRAAGQFKVGYQLAAGASALVPGVFGALLLPMMANALSKGRDIAGRRFAASTSYLALLALPLMAFGVVLAEPAIGLLYGPSYESAGLVFAVCIVGTALTALAQGGSSLLISADRQHAVLWLVVLFGVLKIGLDAWLIKVAGLRGALIAFFLVSAVNASAYLLLAIRESGAAPDWRRILRIAMASVLATLPLWAIRSFLPETLLLLAGAALAIVLYPLLTVMLRCWNRGDIEHMQHLHAKLPAALHLRCDRLLAWAHARTRSAEMA